MLCYGVLKNQQPFDSAWGQKNWLLTTRYLVRRLGIPCLPHPCLLRHTTAIHQYHTSQVNFVLISQRQSSMNTSTVYIGPVARLEILDRVTVARAHQLRVVAV